MKNLISFSLIVFSIFATSIELLPAQAASISKIKQAASVPAFLRPGIAAYQKGFIAKAIPFFEQAAKQSPKSEAAFLWLAKSYQRQGGPADQIKAQGAFEKVLAINPKNIEALNALGEMWSWNPDKRTQAIDLLTRALKVQPNNTVTARKLAEALLWHGQSEEALPLCAFN